ncbi:3-isopropylmalate dehydratase large subunit [Serpentinicella alkaliphila]|uniref:3-isopropylmalate dehydratase large subunit n=1 Tax=Serpentinicella alkaliphila TaxID=1734049 RepID=A0A4R2TQW4_9FIRM|nr:3-isopropylmalate dehydratase large subunit [Serpentinicella alkaliphila]QUH27071.1 3-isopropylmalate dehydratase large subunit [Serpentinicella alkaliphila]TCQ05197.1 3-isopropylmalate/(R)-2-methylmalate dehydratase large subunit [Serpentinicella alkaliphila]
MHAIEKILARASGKKEVRAGEIIQAKVDFAEVNDLYLQSIKSFYEMKGTKVWDPNKIAFILDHYAPAPSIQSAANQKSMREFVKEQGIKYLFDINAGVCHQVMVEEGIVWPGMILIATDSHTTTHGAFGALGTGVGATDLATIMLTGELWFKVPDVIKIEINGKLQTGVMAKDVVLHILSELGTDVAVYKAIEYTGSTVRDMSISERMVLCNMAVEMGAKTSYIIPDEKTIEYVKSRADYEFDILETDEDYKYSAEYIFNVDNLEPQVALPHSVDNGVDIQKTLEIKVDQVFIGTCTGGRLEDLEIAAEIIGDNKIHKDIRLVVIPASKEVLEKSIEKGYIMTLVKAGATITSPGCGPCLGTHQGLLAPGEVCATTSSRNFPGRMGSTEADIYLVSPATAAAIAINGKITDPRYYIKNAKVENK